MKKIILLVISLFLVQTVAALNVATITDLGDGNTITDCVEIGSGDSIYDLYKELDKNRDDIDIDFDGDKIPPYDPFIKSINDLSGKCEDPDVTPLSCLIFSGWNFWITNEANDDFTDPPELSPGWGMGIGDYEITEPEVIGIRYGITEYNADWTIKTPPTQPDFQSYESICQKLIINEVISYIDGDKETIDPGDNIGDAEPGSKLRLKVEVKNIYEEDIEINDIFITATIKNIDDGEDLEEESDEFDLNDGDDETETIEFTIPSEVEEDTYDLEIEVEGEDERGITLSQTLTYTIDVEKERYNIQIKRAELNPPTLKCARTTSLDIRLINLGTEDIEDATLKITSPELELSKQDSFDLDSDPFDEDSKYSDTIPLSLSQGQPAGTYLIDVRVNYGSRSKQESVELVVENCEITKEEIIRPKEKEEVIIRLKDPEIKPITNQETTIETTNTSFLGISMVIAVYVIVLVAGTLLVLLLIKGK